MFDWFDKFGWVLVVFTIIFLGCQVIRFFVWG